MLQTVINAEIADMDGLPQLIKSHAIDNQNVAHVTRDSEKTSGTVFHVKKDKFQIQIDQCVWIHYHAEDKMKSWAQKRIVTNVNHAHWD
jgi:hypothetical protein